MPIFFELFTHLSLTLLVFLPTLLVVPLLFIPESAQETVKRYTLFAFLIEGALGGWFIWDRLAADGTFPMSVQAGESGERIPWISRWGISYDLRIDGISMPLVALTFLLMPLVVLGSWKGIDKRWKAYSASLLLLTTGMLGALLAFDLFLFYIFWELMLVPMYLIIGIWGGERRIYAALKFFLYTMAGSLPMLLAMLWTAWQYRVATGAWSFAWHDLVRLDLPLGAQSWLFAAFAFAFAVKVPLFPLHTWLPDAHVEAPTGGSVVLAGVLLKMGTYGFLRFAFPLFPHGAERLAMPLIVLSVIGILYGALVAWAQTDMKKLVAYSSVAHLGFVMVGLLAFDLVAWQGGLLQMVNHGLSTGALFLCVGMLYDRRHTKKFDEYGGIAKVMPVFAFFLVFSTLASVGLPALNGFVGEFLVLAGAFKSTFMDMRWAVVLSTLGVVFAAIYLLKLLYLTLWGPITRKENEELKDLSVRELFALVPLCIFMLWIGVAPAGFLKPSEAHLQQLLDDVRSRLEQPAPAQATLRASTPWGSGELVSDAVAAATPQTPDTTARVSSTANRASATGSAR
jgi:NADH-quinone oxidoreductase subunit M